MVHVNSFTQPPCLRLLGLRGGNHLEAIRVSPLELPSQCHLHREEADPLNRICDLMRPDRPSEAAVASAESGSQVFLPMIFDSYS